MGAVHSEYRKAVRNWMISIGVLALISLFGISKRDVQAAPKPNHIDLATDHDELDQKLDQVLDALNGFQGRPPKFQLKKSPCVKE